MAVTNYALAGVSDETQKKLQQAQQAYQPGAATTQLQQNLANIQAAKPGAYQQSAAVTAAQNTMNQLQANKPQGYNSKYSAQLESIMQQIQNPEQFKYEFNGDNLFKAYSDLYTQQGKQAALDVQGQAAALTGGYGNSYGQSVGQQTYQQYLTHLYDKGLDLRNAAYQQYLDEQAAKKDQYNMLLAADESDYGRYRDTVGDWRKDLDYATSLYNTERDIDYSRYRDTYGDWQTAEEQAYNRAKAQEQMDYDRYKMELDYWTGLAQIENNAYMTEQERQEAIRQFNLQYEMELDKWNTQKAQLAAAGGGGGGGGGSTGSSGSKPVTYQYNGSYYVKGSDGSLSKTSAEDALSGKYYITDDLEGVANKATSAVFGSNTSKAMNTANTAAKAITNKLTNLWNKK